ncbi:MAG TPA: hypothetical protein VEL82_07345 [Thermoplasmata archaeon]|nr:hypothetical protein [Thermoplasmata archaeon]
MGAAYDFAFRPRVGDADTGAGGPCDDRPHRVELFAATAEPGATDAAWRAFSLCPEHEAQLRVYDGRLVARGSASRFRAASPPQGAR